MEAVRGLANTTGAG